MRTVALTLVITIIGWGSVCLGATAPASPSALNLAQGRTLFRQVCAYCHGTNGQGGARMGAPRLWGKGNVVQGGAYDTPASLSRFIQQYMPVEPVNGINPGSLTPGEAQDLAGYILSKNP